MHVMQFAAGLLGTIIGFQHDILVLRAGKIKLFLQALLDKHLHVFQASNMSLVRQIRASTFTHTVDQMLPHHLAKTKLLL